MKDIKCACGRLRITGLTSLNIKIGEIIECWDCNNSLEPGYVNFVSKS